jgi:hypothetical protein
MSNNVPGISSSLWTVFDRRLNTILFGHGQSSKALREAFLYADSCCLLLLTLAGTP